jgi:hypothetical protein
MSSLIVSRTHTDLNSSAKSSQFFNLFHFFPKWENGRASRVRAAARIDEEEKKKKQKWQKRFEEKQKTEKGERSGSYLNFLIYFFFFGASLILRLALYTRVGPGALTARLWR